jgi:hypothetical protein
MRKKIRQNRTMAKPKSNPIGNMKDVPVEEEVYSAPVETSYSENPLEEPGASHVPASAMGVPVSGSKVEKINSTTKIDQINRVESDLKKKQIDQATTQIKQSETEIKNSEALRKVIEGLLKEIQGSGKSSDNAAPTDAPKIAAPIEKNGLLSTLKGAVSGHVKERLQPIKNLTSFKGISGLVASRYAGNPNSIVGAIASSLYERESAKHEEKERTDNFHTGFTQGTDAGRDLMAQKRAEALDVVKAKNPGLSGKKLDAAVNKHAEVETRKATTILYGEKQKYEERISEITAKERALQAKDKLFGINDTDKEERASLMAKREKLITTGRGSEPSTPVHEVIPDSADTLAQTDKFDKARGKKIYEMESFHGRKLTDEEVSSIDKAMLQQLEIIAGAITHPEKQEPTASQNMEQADKKVSDTLAQEAEGEATKSSKKSLLSRAMSAGEGFLGKGKDLLGKGLGIGKDLVGDAGNILGKGLNLASRFALPAAAAGTAGYGLGTVINDSFEDGHRPSDYLSNMFTSDAEKKLNESLKPGAPVPAKPIPVPPEPIPVPPEPIPVQMEKEVKDTKPQIDEKAAAVDAAKNEKPIIVNSPQISQPIINNSSTTTVMRTPIRNQEPSFMRSLHNSFV